MACLSLFCLVHFLGWDSNLCAQSIKGLVLDAQTGQGLAEVRVQVLNYSPTKSSLSNEKGEFELKALPKGRYRLLVQLEGYEEQILADIPFAPDLVHELQIYLQERQRSSFKLEPRPGQEANLSKPNRPLVQDPGHLLQAKQPWTAIWEGGLAPHAGAGLELDLWRQAAQQGWYRLASQGLPVPLHRGHSQPQVLVNGLQIQIPDRSLIPQANPDLADIEAWSSASSQHRWLSSASQPMHSGLLLNLQSRRHQPNKEQAWRISTGFSPLGIDFKLAGPWRKNQGFILGLRSGNLPFLWQGLGRDANLQRLLGQTPYWDGFYQQHYQAEGSAHTWLAFAYAQGQDGLGLPPEILPQAQYQLFQGYLGLQHQWENELGWSTYSSLGGQMRQSQIQGQALASWLPQNLQQDYANWQINSRFKYQKNFQHKLEGGLWFLAEQLETQFSLQNGQKLQDHALWNYRPEGFIQYSFQSYRDWHLNLGLRLAYQSADEHLRWQPNLQWTWQPHTRHRFLLAYGLSPEELNPALRWWIYPDQERHNLKLPLAYRHQVELRYHWDFARTWQMQLGLYSHHLRRLPMSPFPSRPYFAPDFGLWDFWLHGGMPPYLSAQGRGWYRGIEWRFRQAWHNNYHLSLAGSFFMHEHRSPEGRWYEHRHNNRAYVELAGGKAWRCNSPEATYALSVFVDGRFLFSGGDYQTPLNLQTTSPQGPPPPFYLLYHQERGSAFYLLDAKFGLEFRYQGQSHILSFEGFNLLNSYQGYRPFLPPGQNQLQNLQDLGRRFGLAYRFRF